MKNKLLLFFLLVIFPISLFAATDKNVDKIKKSLEQFVVSWNEGDLNSALEIYKNSPESLLISDSVIKGYPNIAKFWQTSYPEKEKMGQMKFWDISIKMLSSKYAMAIGKWSLTSDDKPTGGIFTVLFENTTQGWKSVVDHTTGL